MEKKINIAEILKDCPSGMELDCTCADNVVFDKVIEYDQIKCVIGESRDALILDKYGQLLHMCCPKCVIFPKDQRDWSKFQRPFKDGDILIGLEDCGNNPFIFKQTNGFGNAQCYCAIHFGFGEFILNSDNWTPIKGCRFATEEEKQKLFDAIKSNGYKWNDETKTLEELVESRFHEGDWITDGVSKCQILFIDDIQYWYSENCILGSIESVDKRYHLWTINDAKDGDILAFDDNTIVIFKDLYNKTSFHSYCHIEDGVFSVSKLDCPDWWDGEFKPATKEQRDFLFQKIKEANYKWNEETKTLEKLIEPKFKVGDKIVHKENRNNPFVITDIINNRYKGGTQYEILIEQQDNFELVTEPKFKVGDRIIKRDSIVNSWIVLSVSSEYYGLKLPNGSEGIGVLSITEQDDYELVPVKFDITTFKPFDKVLVRDNNEQLWVADLFGFHDDKMGYKFICVGHNVNQCIPYNDDTKHLLGTANDCDEYYKNWKL